MVSGLIILLIANILGGGLTPLFVKIGTHEISPVTFTFIRYIIASLVFIPFFLRVKDKPSKKQVKTICFFSILFAVNAVFYGLGLQYTSIIASQVLYTLVPLFVGILAHFIVQEKFTLNKIIGAIISGVGVLVLISGSTDKLQSISLGTPLGNILVLIAVISWSFYLVLSRKMSKNEDPASISFYSYLMTVAVVAPFVPIDKYISKVDLPHISPMGYISLAVVGIVSSAFIFYFIQIGVKKTSAYTASVFSYFAPLFAALTAIPIMHEKVTPQLVVATILITGGVFIATSLEVIKKKFSSKL